MPQGEKAVVDRKAEVVAIAPVRAQRATEKEEKARVVRNFALSGVMVSAIWGINVAFAIISSTVRREMSRDSGAKVRAWHPW